MKEEDEEEEEDEDGEEDEEEENEELLEITKYFLKTTFLCRFCRLQQLLLNVFASSFDLTDSSNSNGISFTFILQTRVLTIHFPHFRAPSAAPVVPNLTPNC